MKLFRKSFLKSSNDVKTNHLYIDVVEARSLRSTDTNSFSDPYVIVTLGPKTKIGKTRVIERTLNPRWMQRFEYSGQIDFDHNAYISFVIKDYDAMSTDDMVGYVEIALQDLTNHMWSQKWYRLQLDDEKERAKGWILLRIHLCDNPDDAFDEKFHDTEKDNTHNEEHVHVHGNEIAVPLATLQDAGKYDEKSIRKNAEETPNENQISSEQTPPPGE